MGSLIIENRFLKHYYKLKAAAYDALGNKCKICGFNDIRALQIDHVNGFDKTEGKRNLQKVYGEILTGSTSYQILCANCNWIKRLTNNETNTNIRYKRNGKELINYLNGLDIPALLETSPSIEEGMPLICHSCRSTDVVKQLALKSENMKGYKLKKYTCKKCGYIGFYKIEPGKVNQGKAI